MSDTMKSIVNDLTKAFSTGVSYMMPTVVVGGIFLALIPEVMCRFRF